MAAESHHQALILRAVNYADADLVLTLLVRGEGKLGAFAKGARKSTRRFRGGLRPFSLIQCGLRTRGGEGLAGLSDSELLESWPALGQDLRKLAHASIITELLDASLGDQQGGGELFERALRFFRWVAAETRGELVVENGAFRFQLILLEQMGHLPEPDVSSRSGEVFPDSAAVVLLDDGGLIGSAERYPGERGHALGPDAYRYLRGLYAGRFVLDVDEAARRQVADALRGTWRALLGRELRSWTFLDALPASDST